MKVTLAKLVSVAGENLVVEYDFPRLDGAARNQIREGFELLDQRTREINQRILTVERRYQELTHEHPELAPMVHDLISVLSGQRLPERTGAVAVSPNGLDAPA
jgi:hypothetical protein